MEQIQIWGRVCPCKCCS